MGDFLFLRKVFLTWIQPHPRLKTKEETTEKKEQLFLHPKTVYTGTIFCQTTQSVRKIHKSAPKKSLFCRQITATYMRTLINHDVLYRKETARHSGLSQGAICQIW